MTSTNPQVDSSTAPAGQHTLARTLGVRQIVFMVIAGAAPLTVVVGIVPLMMSMGNGIGAPLDYLVAGAILLLFAVGFATMSGEVKNAGAFYAYIQKGLGRIPGLGAASLAMMTYLFVLVAVVAYLGAAVSNAIASYTDTQTPWWLWTVIALASIAFLGHRNVELSAKVLGVVLIAEIAIVAVVDLCIVVAGGDAGLSAAPFAPAHLLDGAVGTGVMFAIFGYVGFEATAAFRSEAKDPDRTIPRATFTAVGVITVFYTISAWAVIVGAGVDNAVAAATDDPVNLVLDLGDRFAGRFAHDLMQVLLVTSFYACTLTFHNVAGRYVYTLGRLGALPNRLGDVHERHRSPYVASALVVTVVTVLLAIMAVPGLDPVVQIYAWLSGAATLGVVSLMALTSLAVIVFFARNARPQSIWKKFVAPAAALLGLLIAIALIVGNFATLVGSQWMAWLLGSVLVVSFVIGMGWSLGLRAARPEAFERLDADLEN
ncbi:amino acid transporter [Mycobacterium sp. ACS4331]|nr:amino acid transporter [Mycobacterium sp. ACS4331]